MTLTSPQVTAVQNEYNSNPFEMPYEQQTSAVDLATIMNGPVVNPNPVTIQGNQLVTIVTEEDGLLGTSQEVGTTVFLSWVETTFSGEHAEQAEAARTYFGLLNEYDVTQPEPRGNIDYLRGVEIEQALGPNKTLYSEDAMIAMLALGELRRMQSVIGRDITSTEVIQALGDLWS